MVKVIAMQVESIKIYRELLEKLSILSKRRAQI